MGICDDLSFGPVILLRQLAPHKIQTQFGEAAFSCVRFHVVSIESEALASVEIGDVAILVFWGSNPARVSASLHLQLEKGIYVLDKETALSHLRIVLRDVIFVHFENLEHFVTLLHCQPNLVHDPGARQSPLGVRLVRALLLEILFDGARDGRVAWAVKYDILSVPLPVAWHPYLGKRLGRE